MLKMTNRFLGGILLVAGTTIGAGMLALPVITSFSGFFPSVLIFLICWALMLASAFFFLDVNLAVRGEPNFVSMAGKTLGPFGKGVSWVFYLLLLYSLIAAYIAASTPLFVDACHFITGHEMPSWLAPFSLPVLFGGFIYFGTMGVDYLNRLLMLGLILSYVVLVGFVPSHIEPVFLGHVDMPASLLSIPVVITSFGYHIIIPTLTTYMEHNKKLLRKTILIGSLIPIVIYLIWQCLVLGVVPLPILAEAWSKGVPATEPLSQLLQVKWIGLGARFFSFFAIVTSFLGVSLSLSDFLSDGLKIKKTWEGRLIAFALTFVPPLLFVFTYQRGFYMALEYAGAFVAVLLGILPALMAWKLKQHGFYQRGKGRCLIAAVILLCAGVILVDLLQKQGFLNPFILPYLSR
jgi:tyrosine-specific transport protein